MTRKGIGTMLGATGLVFFAVFLVSLLAGSAYAGQSTNDGQPPFRGRGPGGPGRMGGFGGPGDMLGPIMMMARELDLTDAQKTQIKSIADLHREEWRALADRERAAQQALNAAVTADTFDETLIRQRSSERAAVEADMAVARARAYAEVFQVLTPEQQAKARAARERRRDVRP